MLDRVKKVLASVLDIPESELTDKAALGFTPNWDSMRHMNLIVALEEEFDVRFDDAEVVEMLTVPLIVDILEKKVTP